jgi:hypothetical protein
MPIVKKKAVAQQPVQSAPPTEVQQPAVVEHQQVAQVVQTSQVGQQAAQTPPPAANANKAPSWMLRGQDVQKAYAEDAAKAEAAKAQAGKMYPFRMKEGEVGRVTFLDGNLGADGLMDVLAFYQHTVKLDGKWQSFVCVGGGHGDHGSEPCPICESGNNPSLVSVFTVIDHRPYTIQNGKNKGQVVVNQRKLFLAKKTTLAKLQLKANMYGGLAGVTMQIARIDDGTGKTPGVGTDFDFIEKQDLATLAQKYGAEHAQVADYSKEIVYLDAAKLLALGLGKAPAGPGYAPSGFNSQKMAEQI